MFGDTNVIGEIILFSNIHFINMFFFRVNLAELEKLGVPIYYTVQRPGDIIVTSSFHQVRNILKSQFYKKFNF